MKNLELGSKVPTHTTAAYSPSQTVTSATYDTTLTPTKDTSRLITEVLIHKTV